MAIYKKKINICIILLFFATRVCGYLERDLWFDEALTLLNFALLPSPNKIYHSYIIPNNQILYTIAIHFWLKFTPANVMLDYWVRIISVLFGALNIIVIYRCFYRKYSHNILSLVLLALSISPIYLNYATAVRGYMLSMLLISCSLACGVKFAHSGSWLAVIGYVFSCLGAVATLPSNLLGLSGVVLYACSECKKMFFSTSRFYILTFIPLLMFAIFYYPILPQLLAAANLGEGWSQGYEVIMVVSLAQLFIFGPMIFVSFYGAIKKISLQRCIATAIWLLPVPATLLFKVAPFPRVFFPLFGIFSLLIANGISSAFAKTASRYRQKMTLVLILLTLFWGGVSQLPAWREQWSNICGNPGRDDFFYSHYLRPDFTPRKTVEQIYRDYPQTAAIYHSFSSDPWATMYYLQLYGIQAPQSFFDGPRGEVVCLPDKSLLILRCGENIIPVAKRFGGTAEKLFSNSMHQVYIFRK